MRKKLAARVEPLTLTALMGIGQAPLFAVWMLWAGAEAPRAGYVPEAAGSITFALVGNLFIMRALQVSPLSLTIPFLSFSPVFTVLLVVRSLPPPRLHTRLREHRAPDVEGRRASVCSALSTTWLVV